MDRRLRGVGACALVACALLACRGSSSRGKTTSAAGGPDAATSTTDTPDPLLAGPRVHGVIAGVLSFADSTVTPFSPELRKDRELYEVLRARGVPAEQLRLLLDQQATAEQVREAVRRTAASVPADGTLLFYYAGHGARDGAGGRYFLAHDTAGGNNRLGLQELTQDLTKSFRGRRLVLMADCCYSGALQVVAEQVASSRAVQAIALTSADMSNLSTVNWTFTQTVIDGLRGEPLADANADGTVSLGELASEVATAMKYRESQRHGFFCSGVPLETSVTRTSARLPPSSGARFAPGQYVRASYGERNAVARVREADGGQSLVRFYRYNQAEDVRVDDATLAPITFRSYPVGAALGVFWGGKIWDAKVQKQDGDFLWITYPGWPAHWDEWILSDRVAADRPGGELGSKPQGETVEVQWRGRWYPAVVLLRTGERRLIHYVGYDASWDEWVGPERVRKRAP